MPPAEFSSSKSKYSLSIPKSQHQSPVNLLLVERMCQKPDDTMAAVGGGVGADPAA